MAKDTYIPRDEVVSMHIEFNKVRKKAEKELMALPGVLSVGVGLKEVKGELERELCFKVTVEKKKAKRSLRKKDIIPETIYMALKLMSMSCKRVYPLWQSTQRHIGL